MDKIKSNKIVLMVLIIIALLAGAYFYSYQQLFNKYSQLKNEIVTKQGELEQYKNIQKVVSNYDSVIKELKYEESLFRDQYPSDIYQEDVILLLNKLTDNEKAFKMENAMEFNAIEPYDPKSKNLVQMSVSLGTLTFDNYTQVKDFYNKVIEFLPKVVLGNEVRIAINSKKKLDVKFDLLFLGYKDDTKHENLFKYEDEPGNSNIFAEFQGMPSITNFEENDNNEVKDVLSAASQLQTKYDFYTVLSPAKGELPTIVTGRSGYGSKTVFQDIDGIGQIEFRFEKGADGKYYYKYKSGKYTYPFDYSKMEEFKPVQNGKIILLVRGNNIKDSNDNVGAKIDIYNSTGLPVTAILTGNSKDHDKVKVVAKEGKVETLLENY